MFDAAVCLSVEEIGVPRTIDGLLAVLKFFSEECPGEFAALLSRTACSSLGRNL